VSQTGNPVVLADGPTQRAELYVLSADTGAVFFQYDTGRIGHASFLSFAVGSRSRVLLARR
jgi:hypothetical protein